MEQSKHLQGIFKADDQSLETINQLFMGCGKSYHYQPSSPYEVGKALIRVRKVLRELGNIPKSSKFH